MADAAQTFTLERNPSPVADATRDELLIEPGFGQVFTDHMARVDYSTGRGWHSPRICSRQPFSFDPATAVLHYAQEIFEGLKAYRLADGGVALFRAEANARRFRDSARRMAMPELPEELFLDACRTLVRTDADWIPPGPDGALYLRPFAIASSIFLGVRPSSDYKFSVVASSVGPYWRKGAAAGISIWATTEYSRAAPGGTGDAKCGGNYASSLVAQAEAIRHGCDQVVFLDAVERRWVEELGGMNIFFVFDDGSIQTPPLTGTILPGITRASLLTLARDGGITVREELYSLDQWRADAASGRLTETFACGTAAVVTPIGRVESNSGGFTIGGGGPGQLTQRLRDGLVAIQRGQAPDPHGWVKRL